MSSTEPLLGGSPKTAPFRRPNKRQVIRLLVGCILAAWLLTYSMHRHHKKIKYPHLPKIPAHVPIMTGPTWDPNDNETVVAHNGAVASDIDVCSEMGVEVLKKGGFAADAAVTTCLCIGTLHTMFSSGIGGGAFITSKRADEEGALSIDGREMAPAAAYKDMFAGREIASKYGGLSTATPGELRALYTLFKEHGSGKLTWSDLVMPVAELARKGWKVTPGFEFALHMQREAFKLYKKDWQFVYNEDGKLKKTGDDISRPAYADTLELIARNGSDAVFYDPKGPIAPFLVRKVREYDGVITTDDFAKYQAVVEPAYEVTGFADNKTIFVPAGSSSGPALAAGLNILAGFKHSEHENDFGPITTQRLVETMKWMSSARTHLGDVCVYNENQTAIAEHKARYRKYSGKKWADYARSKISDNHTLPWQDYEPAYQNNDPHGTSSLSVLDKFGNAVSITTTVNLLFGSCVHDPATGVILNDEMDDFSVPTSGNAFQLQPSVYNYIEPYKRPLSSCSQSIVFDTETKKVDMAIGAAGGSRITTAVLQALTRTYHYNMTLLDTIAFPRLHHQLLPEFLFIEDPANETMIAAMEAMGHQIQMVSHVTAMNAIKVHHGMDGDEIHAQSDAWRKLGRAAGY